MNDPLIAVLDTNVWVSGLLRRAGPPAKILERFRDNAFLPAMSPQLLGELVSVLTRAPVRRRMARELIEELMEDCREDVRFLLPSERPLVVAGDPDDDELFACALAAGADCIVSGDAAVLAVGRFRGIDVVSPAAFLARLSAP